MPKLSDFIANLPAATAEELDADDQAMVLVDGELKRLDAAELGGGGAVSSVDGATGAVDLSGSYAPASGSTNYAAAGIVAANRLNPVLTLYVDAAAGNDTTGTGLSGAPYESIDKALTVAGNVDVTIKVRAPSSAPLRGRTSVSSTGLVVLEPWDSDPVHWWGTRSYVNPSWTANGGGIYSANTGRTANMVVVPTMTETIGDRTFFLMLKPTAGTQTAPAAGEFGYSGSTLYIHLPGDVSPATHTIEAPASGSTWLNGTGAGDHYCLMHPGTGTLIVRNFRFFAANIAHVYNTAGTVILEDCSAVFAGNSRGCYSHDAAAATILRRCVGWRALNDGANVKTSGYLHAIDCDLSYNEDEGASPHEASKLYISGGSLRHNGSAGATAVDTATMVIDRNVLVEENHRNGSTTAEGGLTWWASTTSGRIDGAVCRDNAGAGVLVKAGASVAINGLLSGTGAGNGAVDNLAA